MKLIKNKKKKKNTESRLKFEHFMIFHVKIHQQFGACNHPNCSAKYVLQRMPLIVAFQKANSAALAALVLGSTEAPRGGGAGARSRREEPDIHIVDKPSWPHMTGGDCGVRVSGSSDSSRCRHAGLGSTPLRVYGPVGLLWISDQQVT